MIKGTNLKQQVNTIKAVSNTIIILTLMKANWFKSAQVEQIKLHFQPNCDHFYTFEVSIPRQPTYSRISTIGGDIIPVNGDQQGPPFLD